MAVSRTTLRDIAAMVGVHPSTVSRVLNPKTRAMVSPEVAERVVNVARDLGYRPNPVARGLKTNRSNNIGVVVPDLMNPIFPEMVRGAEDVLMSAGYTPIVANATSDPARKSMIADHLHVRQVEGILIATADRNDAIVQLCERDNIPMVVNNLGAGDREMPGIVVDDRQAMQAVFEHLVGLGHRRIALLSGPQDHSSAISRHSAAIRAMQIFDLPQDPALIVFARSYSTEEGKEACKRLLDQIGHFTAIVTSNDLLAFGALHILRANGIACPDQVSLTGFNDIYPSAYMTPPLTTVHLPAFEIGKRMADMLLDGLRNPATDRESVLIRQDIVVRGSTGPAPAL